MNSPIESLERLKLGNERFVAGRLESAATRGHSRREELVSGQAPFAAILGCIDSRVPVEVVFDAGLGDLMVARVAGNYASPAVLGSLEFAASQAKAPLIVVLGHSGCGAVRATHQALENSDGCAPGHLQDIVDALAPTLLVSSKQHAHLDQAALLAQATEDHVRATVQRIRDESKVLAEREGNGELLIVGAHYDLRTGAVRFLE